MISSPSHVEEIIFDNYDLINVFQFNLFQLCVELLKAVLNRVLPL